MKKQTKCLRLFCSTMKLTFYQLIISGLLSAAAFAGKADAQRSMDQKVTINMKSSELKAVLNALQQSTGFNFTYSSSVIPSGMKVNIKADDHPLSEVLNDLFRNTSIRYKQEGKQIILYQAKNVGEVSTSTEQPDRSVRGKVTDTNGEAMPSVTIRVKGTNKGTTTLVDGTFSFEVADDNAILVFSFMGYESQEIAVGSRSQLDISLKADVKALSEVVVVGYGTQKKVNLTGAITVADPEKLANRPITTSSQALQGLNGLYVNQNTSQPGNDQATIRIRGVGTLNDNNPLILVDGISYPLLDINPNEIESISVLKDAASTAVYGSRAANGVILIKTKAGKRGEGYRVSYNNYFGIENITKLPDVEWDPIRFMRYKNIALANEGKAREYTEAEIDEYEKGMAGDPNGYMYPRTNPYEIALKDGFIQEHNVTVSGGGENHNLALTFGALN